jgi:hypothetical protein
MFEGAARSRRLPDGLRSDFPAGNIDAWCDSVVLVHGLAPGLSEIGEAALH